MGGVQGPGRVRLPRGDGEPCPGVRDVAIEWLCRSVKAKDAQAWKGGMNGRAIWPAWPRAGFFFFHLYLASRVAAHQSQNRRNICVRARAALVAYNFARAHLRTPTRRANGTSNHAAKVRLVGSANKEVGKGGKEHVQ